MVFWPLLIPGLRGLMLLLGKKTKPFDLTYQTIRKLTFKEGAVFPVLEKSIPLHCCGHINMKCSSCSQSCFHSAKSSKDSWQPQFSCRLSEYTGQQQLLWSNFSLTLCDSKYLMLTFSALIYIRPFETAQCSPWHAAWTTSAHLLHVFSCHLQLLKY